MASSSSSSPNKTLNLFGVDRSYICLDRGLTQTNTAMSAPDQVTGPTLQGSAEQGSLQVSSHRVADTASHTAPDTARQASTHELALVVTTPGATRLSAVTRQPTHLATLVATDQRPGANLAAASSAV